MKHATSLQYIYLKTNNINNGEVIFREFLIIFIIKPDILWEEDSKNYKNMLFNALQKIINKDIPSYKKN